MPVCFGCDGTVRIQAQRLIVFYLLIESTVILSTFLFIIPHSPPICQEGIYQIFNFFARALTLRSYSSADFAVCAISALMRSYTAYLFIFCLAPSRVLRLTCIVLFFSFFWCYIIIFKNRLNCVFRLLFTYNILQIKFYIIFALNTIL